MTKIILVGGNGYIGREITRQWLKRDRDVQIYVTSRSDRQEIKDERVHHIQVDVANYDLTIAYGADRNDDLAGAIVAGYMDAIHPVRVEVVACCLIDELLKSWLA